MELKLIKDKYGIDNYYLIINYYILTNNLTIKIEDLRILEKLNYYPDIILDKIINYNNIKKIDNRQLLIILRHLEIK